MEKQETVDFAIWLPGWGKILLMLSFCHRCQISAHYFARLLAAVDASDMELAEVFRRELSARIRQEAKKISELYIFPPKTTDFAIRSA